MHITVFDLVKHRTVLAGAGAGSQLFIQLCEIRSTRLDAEIVFLDFEKIEVATTSFLRESIIFYRDHCRNSNSLLYPVCANLSAEIEEELNNFLLQTNDAFPICELNAEHNFFNPRVIGFLDEKQAQAFALIVNTVNVDAPTLSRLHGKSENVGPTAWNNRLASLSRKSLIVGKLVGRSIQFSPVLKGMFYGK